MPQFVQDIEEIRQRAIQKIEKGAVTNAYRGDVEKTISILNEALATEIVCVLRYMHHYFMATGVHGKSVAGEFKEHADAEREHADELAERIQQLGGKPDLNPGTLVQRSASQYKEGESLADMIREDLIAERVVIEVYNEMIRYFGENDPTTRVLIEHILSEEEEHASELADLLYVVDPSSGETAGQDPGSDPLRMERGNGGRGQQRQASGGREPLQQEGETCEMELNVGSRRTQGRQPQGRGQQPNQNSRDAQRGDGSPGIEKPRGRNGRDQRGNRPQGRGPSFRNEQPGTAFAGEDRPNPPGRAGSAALEPGGNPTGGQAEMHRHQQHEQFAGRGSTGAPQDRGGRGRRGRRGRRAA